MKKSKLPALPILFSLIFSLTSTDVVAQQLPPDVNLYGSFGLTNHKIGGSAVDCATCSESDTGVRGAFGLTYQDYMQAEATYYNVTGFDTGNQAQAELNMQAMGFGAAARIPVSNSFFFKPKIGYISWDMKRDGGRKTSGDDILLGLGFDVKLDEKLHATFGGEQFNTDDNDVRIFYGGILYNF